jgi:peptide/nickel transport system permease protein
MIAVPADAPTLDAAPATPGARRRRPSLSVLIGATILGVLGLAAIFAPLLAPYGPDHLDFTALLSPPSAAHLMGTDDTGRDILSRCLYALRIDLLVVVFVTYIPLPVGVLMGAIAGYFGGAADATVSRLADVMIAFPFIVLVIAIIAIIGPGIGGVLVGVPLVGWALYARLARAQMLVLRQESFMLATKALGYSRRRAILRHAIPNLVGICLVYSTLDMVGNILLLAGLSYLGLGVQPPTPELGAMIANGQPYLLTAWWVATLPGLVLVLFGLGAGLVGDGITNGRFRGGSR